MGLACGCLTLSLALASPACAQSAKRGQELTFNDMFESPNAAAPQAVAFAAGPNNLRFVLDRSQPRVVLLQFDGDPEVWALTSSWGPRGDEFLRNDIGEVIVRITTLGGVTVYGPLGTNGGLAASQGKAKSLPAPSRSEGTLQATLQKALRWFDRFSSRSIRVEASGGLPPALVHEALERAAQGMSRAPRGYFGRPERKVKLIRVQRSFDQPSVRWQSGVLTIGVVPGAGYAGRPSSAAVLLALTRSR
ncbi:hypothetical protein PbB2_02870 [Candidatus Phycosocius bacilliformis]|uniref:Uncharacterized protein n=1 Tax=Candidatus Phycosocius bacilliformis TaxID=1445552 RepID=A0A2P2EDP5_9PROT|nr:hypothetical protein PbB2_02870 [Candidatus Phycosocius bacilliformis]